MQPLAELGALMGTTDPPLDRSLAVLAAVVDPTVSVDGLLAQLDALAASCTADDAEGLCAELFGDGGLFAGE